ncbi:MAG: TolC family protein [bacterium]
MYQVFCTFVLLFLIFILPCFAEESAPALTLREIILQAVENNPTLKTLEHQYRASLEQYRGSGLLPNPELILSGGTGDILEDANSISQRFPIFGKTAAKKHVAREEMNLAKLAWEAGRQELIASVSAACFELEKFNKFSSVAGDSLKNAQEVLRVARKRCEVGDIPAVELRKAEIDEARARQDLKKSESDLFTARARLNLLLSRTPDSPLVLQDQPGPPDEFSLPDLDSLKRMARDNRPELKAAGVAISRDESRVSLLKSESSPEMMLSAYLSKFEPNSPDAKKGALLSIGFPLLDLGTQRSAVRSGRESVLAAKRSYEATRQQVLFEVETLYREVLKDYDRLKIFGAEILLSAEKTIRTSQRAYAAGMSTYLDVLEAQRTFRDVQKEYFEVLAEFRAAEAYLERAVGVSLFQGKDRIP